MKLLAALFGVCLLLEASTSIGQTEEVIRYEWDLTEIYPTIAEWEDALEAVNREIEDLEKYKGTLGNSAQTMLAGFKKYSKLNKESARVYVYTSLGRDADQREPKAQARFGLARQMFNNLNEATSWISPELLSIGEDRISQFFGEESALADFEFIFRDTLRNAPHTLDERTEAVLAQAGMILSAPQQIYGNYANADIPWPTITLSEGTEVTLSQAGYGLWRAVNGE